MVDGDNTLDLFDVDDSAMDIDPDPAPAPVRFQPKLKGKIKGEQSKSNALVPVPGQELGQSTRTDLVLPDPDEEDEVVREIDVFCNPLDEGAQV